MRTRRHRAFTAPSLIALIAMATCALTAAAPAQSATSDLIGIAIAVVGLLMAIGVLFAIRRHRERKRLPEGESS